MDGIDWYLILFLGILGFIGLRQSWAIFLRLASRGLLCFFSRYIQYPLAPAKRLWSVTRLQAFCLLVYLACNILVLLLSLRNVQQLEQRAATMAVINMVPLFLGGRTNPLADFLGISHRSYYFAHNWIGRVAIVEALLLSIIVLTLRPRPGSVATSGFIALSTTGTMIVISLWIFRRYMGDFFPISHAILALVTLSGIIWHVFVLSSVLTKVLASISAAIWASTTFARMILIMCRGRRVLVKNVVVYDGVALINITAKHQIHGFPGAYFYVTFPGTFWHYDIWRSYSMTVLWKSFSTDSQLSPKSSSQEFSLVVPNQEPSARMLYKLEDRRYVLLEGPYGQALPLHIFENVFLVAKGIGILRVLQSALNLAERRLYDDTIRSTVQDLPGTEALLLKAEKQWKAREEELTLDEQELSEKFDRMSSSQKKNRRKLEIALESESKSLKKERTAIQRERDEIKQRRLQLEKGKGRMFGIPLHSDSTRKIDLFWWLDNNDQIIWAKHYLQELQKLDPSNRLLVVWCIFPSPKRKDSGAPFKRSQHWVCIYSSPQRPDFHDMVVSTLKSESQMSPGQTIVVCSGNNSFTNTIRSGVVEAIRPDRLVEFAEVGVQQKSPVSFRNKWGSEGTSQSFWKQSSTSSFDTSHV